MGNDLYSLPEIYELAFSFRDYTEAVDFLIGAAKRAGLTEITSMVEYGCGPGQYCREFARRGVQSLGIDLSPEMVLYANLRADAADLPCEIVEGDMRTLVLDHPVDFACCMMATFGYLYTNDDVLTHLKTAAKNLKTAGIYVIELPHPKGLFGIEETTHDQWEMEGDGIKLSIDWCNDARFDPLTEIDTGTVKFSWEQGGESLSHEAIDSTRRIPKGLIDALVQQSGCFEIVERYGDVKLDQPFDNTKKSWRMVLVLRKS
jgi:SAM-dependent methyltransferase